MKQCNCSYDGVTVTLPTWVDALKTNRTVSIDNCILQAIVNLWDASIETLSCCCGHGKLPPSIVVVNGYDKVEIEKIHVELRKYDERDWDIYQWQLIKV